MQAVVGGSPVNPGLQLQVAIRFIDVHSAFKPHMISVQTSTQLFTPSESWSMQTSLSAQSVSIWHPTKTKK